MDGFDTVNLVYGALLVVFAVLGLYWLGGGLRRIGRRQLVRGGLRGLWGACFLLAALLLLSLGLNFRLYHRFTEEQPLVELWFVQAGPQYYSAEIRYPDGSVRMVDLHGDQWQLDARVLKWKAPATVMGLDPLYQLERISGRYRQVDQARSATYSAYGLGEEPMIDTIQLAEKHLGWVPWTDTVYGSATYMPMADRAGYAVTLSNTGLVARPLNEQARQAVANWN